MKYKRSAQNRILRWRGYKVYIIKGKRLSKDLMNGSQRVVSKRVAKFYLAEKHFIFHYASQARYHNTCGQVWNIWIFTKINKIWNPLYLLKRKMFFEWHWRRKLYQRKSIKDNFYILNSNDNSCFLKRNDSTHFYYTLICKGS